MHHLTFLQMVSIPRCLVDMTCVCCGGIDQFVQIVFHNNMNNVSGSAGLQAFRQGCPCGATDSWVITDPWLSVMECLGADFEADALGTGICL